ncbi:MAG: preprotein translocase subunit SecE [Phycisphaerae bacterium]|nr:preprotein translocase subunit SecE [Phycisphaerae bacterium]
MRFEIYKSGQGKYTRLCTGLSGGILLGLGCYSLYNVLELIGSSKAGAWFQATIPALLFAVLGIVIFKLVNIPRFADFMIQTEGEMKKVSWSSRKEIITSTKVVIITVFLMALFLMVIDGAFAWAFSQIGVLKELG